MRLRRAPGLDLEQPLGRFLCAGEIGNAPVRREWKARQPLGLQAIPHRLARLVLVGEIRFHGAIIAKHSAGALVEMLAVIDVQLEGAVAGRTPRDARPACSMRGGTALGGDSPARRAAGPARSGRSLRLIVSTASGMRTRRPASAMPAVDRGPVHEQAAPLQRFELSAEPGERADAPHGVELLPGFGAVDKRSTKRAIASSSAAAGAGSWLITRAYCAASIAGPSSEPVSARRSSMVWCRGSLTAPGAVAQTSDICEQRRAFKGARQGGAPEKKRPLGIELPPCAGRGGARRRLRRGIGSAK